MNALSSADCFSQSYGDARAAFLRACADARAEITSYCHPLSAPDGAPLFLDVARVGAPDARRALFLASGTHGVEGFCGSGIQTFLLGDPTRGRVFLVECNGDPVATLTLTLEWSDWRNGFFWWIQSVYVSPAHRRRGHYRRLHDHVRTLAACDPNVCGLRLYVEHENHAAEETYRALGMHETYYRLFEQPIQSEA